MEKRELEAAYMTRGAWMYGRGISSTRCAAPSKAVRPKVDWRRPRMKAMPSGHCSQLYFLISASTPCGPAHSVPNIQTLRLWFLQKADSLAASRLTPVVFVNVANTAFGG